MKIKCYYLIVFLAYLENYFSLKKISKFVFSFHTFLELAIIKIDMEIKEFLFFTDDSILFIICMITC